MGDERDVEGLIKDLKHENTYVRRSATWALEKIGDPRAVEPLIRALKDEDKDVRHGATRAHWRVMERLNREKSRSECLLARGVWLDI